MKILMATLPLLLFEAFAGTPLDSDLSELETRISATKQSIISNYVAAIDRAYKRALLAGDLEASKQLRSESDLWASENWTPFPYADPSMSAELRKLRGILDGRLSKIYVQGRQARAALVRDNAAIYQVYVTALVEGGKLDEAEAFQQKLNEIRNPPRGVTFTGGAELVPLTVGSRVYSDQGYTWQQLPESLKGSSATRDRKGNAITFQVHEDMVVRVISSGGALAQPTEWRSVGEAQYRMHLKRKNVRLVLYQRKFLAGQSFSLGPGQKLVVGP